MAYTITTGLEQTMIDAVDKDLKEVSTTQDRKAVRAAILNLIDLMITEFESVDQT